MPKVASPLYGCEVPRLWTPPLRKLTPATTRGYQCIRFAEDVLGMTLLPWQRWLLLHMLELRPDGNFRFRTVLILVARQNGKSTIAQVVALWRMYVDGAALVIGTAQSLDVAEDVWQATVDLAQGVPDLAAEIEKVDQTNGKKALRLVGGQRYKVAAATRKAGRSLSADEVLLDELREHTKWDAWAAVTKTTNARPRAQVLCMSNAGDDRSVVLNDLREKALAAIEGGAAGTRIGLFEWSAPDDCDIWDRDGWAQGNPSLGYLVGEDVIAASAESDPEPVFRTEVLCQRVAQLRPAVIPAAWWADRCDPESKIVGPVTLGVDVTLDRGSSVIAVAGRNAAGVPQVEIADMAGDTAWVASRVAGMRDRHNAYAVGIRNAGPVTSLADDMEPVERLTGPQMAAACGKFYDLARNGGMVHRVDDRLTDSLAAAAQHHVGDAWTWERTNVDVDAAPLVAATVALYLLLTVDPPKKIIRSAPRRLR